MNDDNARNTEIEERSAVLKRRFGNQLNAEQMDEVAKGVEATVDISLALNRFQLTTATSHRLCSSPTGRRASHGGRPAIPLRTRAWRPPAH